VICSHWHFFSSTQVFLLPSRRGLVRKKWLSLCIQSLRQLLSPLTCSELSLLYSTPPLSLTKYLFLVSPIFYSPKNEVISFALCWLQHSCFPYFSISLQSTRLTLPISHLSFDFCQLTSGRYRGARFTYFPVTPRLLYARLWKIVCFFRSWGRGQPPL